MWRYSAAAHYLRYDTRERGKWRQGQVTSEGERERRIIMTAKRSINNFISQI